MADQKLNKDEQGRIIESRTKEVEDRGSKEDQAANEAKARRLPGVTKRS